MMTGHRHSMWTPGLLRLLKSSETFEARPQQRHILCHWPKRGKKMSSFRLEEAHECARENGRAEREQKEGRKSEAVWRWSDQQTPEKRPRITNILKSRKALYVCRSSALQFFAPYTPRVTSTNRGHLSIPCSCHRFISLPLWNHPTSTFLLPCPFFLFPGLKLQRTLTSLPRCRGPINQCKIFALTEAWLRDRAPIYGH